MVLSTERNKMMNSFFEMAKQRQSCRSFSDRPVEREKLEAITEAARIAPSARNRQPWRLTVVTNEEKLRLTAECVQEGGVNLFASGAKAFIVISQHREPIRPGHKDFVDIDTGLMTANMCYAAQELGLATCILGWRNEKKLQEIFDIPEEDAVPLVLAVGYAASDEIREKNRKAAGEIIRWEE